MIDDRTFDLVNEVFLRDGVKITPMEAKLLQLLIDVRRATHDRIDDHLWPDEDGFDCDFKIKRCVLICGLRQKFGKLIEIVNFSGQGYSLKRLGHEGEPLHERKINA